MRKLILVGGDLAAGKSTFANVIGDKLDLLVVNKDRLKEIIGDHIMARDRDENIKFSNISFDCMKYLIEKNRGVLVLESNFKPYEMKEITALINKYEYEAMSLVLSCDVKILHARFQERLNEDRHYVHRAQDFTNINDFVETLNELRSTVYPGKVINIDASTFACQEDEKLLNEIKEFVEK